MGIEAQFNRSDVAKRFQKHLENLIAALTAIYIRVGEEFVNTARERGSYQDQTGNLRSSIGYIILYNGERVAGAIPGDQSEGKAKAEALLQEIAARYSTGLVLIVVAGMEYAAAVESKGKDVLTGSSLQAETDLQEAINRIRNKK